MLSVCGLGRKGKKSLSKREKVHTLRWAGKRERVVAWVRGQEDNAEVQHSDFEDLRCDLCCIKRLGNVWKVELVPAACGFR